MNAEIIINHQCAIVYDGDRVKDPAARLFDPGYWVRSGSVTGTAPGRGSVHFIDTPFGPAALRRYQRGGWPARFSHDAYLFTGYRRSRPVREFLILDKLSSLNLPVPEPLAAMCQWRHLVCRGALLTRRLTGVAPLGDCLESLQDLENTWPAIGACIARFHRAGVSHADLNARNVLVSESGRQVFLVDFDRCRYRPGIAVNGRSNLARLERSLRRLWPAGWSREADRRWRLLLSGYHG